MTTFTQDPDEVLDYQVDWADYLAVGETISASTWVVSSGLTTGSTSYTTTTATIWLSGGTVGVTYTVINRITTSSARVIERGFYLLIMPSGVSTNTVSATQLITTSLRLLGVLDAVDTAEAEDLALGKTALDSFVDGLGVQRAAIYMETRSVYPLTASQASYTIGQGGDFNQVRPVWIERASVRPDRTASPVLEIPLGRPLTVSEYQAIPAKTTTGSYPTSYYYDHNWASGLGTVTVYPVPSVSVCDLVLYTPTAVSRFQDLTTGYTLPPGWQRMYTYNLAIEMADFFGATPSPRVEMIARESLAWVKRANWRPTDLALDPLMPGLRGGGRYNLLTDGYGGTY